ncbi:uncharacterized protein LOC110821184 isoform X2 [Carica papaya]|uniref:uncharacterized protein LOC110821184 isoform X2 n=1 Tax=Carica papaya TaxID=3649 RepID=UPI000B8CE6DA|nr:uncharacterized protein LOC110821184 isoform X2 [Carica papaya]
MQGDEARVLLGFPPNSRPTLSQVKAAYKSKVWESHPDLFPAYEKPLADSKFKLISEAYACLLSGARGNCSTSGNLLLMKFHFFNLLSNFLSFGFVFDGQICTHKLFEVEFQGHTQEEEIILWFRFPSCLSFLELLDLGDLMLPGLIKSRNKHVLLIIRSFPDSSSSGTMI